MSTVVQSPRIGVQSNYLQGDGADVSGTGSALPDAQVMQSMSGFASLAAEMMLLQTLEAQMQSASSGQASGDVEGNGTAPQGPTAAQQNTIDGNSTELPAEDEKAPPGMTAADIGKLDNGLLGHLGNQNLQGKGGVADLLAQKAGGADAGSLKTDPDVAWRVYKTLVAFKNEKEASGKSVPDSVVHDGRVDGMPGKDALRGTNMGDIQDYLLHGRAPSSLQTGGDTSIYANADGTDKSGAQVVGEKFKKVALKILLPILLAPLMLIPGVGEAAEGAAIGAEAAAAGAEAGAEAGAAAGAEAGAAGAEGVAEGAGEAGAEGAGEAGAEGVGETAGQGLGEAGVQGGVGEGSMAQQMVQALLNQVRNQLEDQLKDQLRDQMQSWLNSNPQQDNATPQQVAQGGPAAFQQTEGSLRADMERFLRSNSAAA